MKKLLSFALALGIVLTLAGCSKELIDIESVNTISIEHYATDDDYSNHCEPESVEITDTAELADICEFINSLADTEDTGRPNDLPRYEIHITFLNGDTSWLTIGQYNVVSGDLLGCGNKIPSKQTDCYTQVTTIIDGIK